MPILCTQENPKINEISNKSKYPTEPVVAGLRSVCCGDITENIFLETTFFLVVWMQNEGCDEKADRPTSLHNK